MNVRKMAARDAHRWAEAEMFYGKGAGTRRKHLKAEIDQKIESYPGGAYWDAFWSAYDKLDMNKYAKNAIKERKAIDRKEKVNRNVRGLATGNTKSLTTSVAIFATAYYVAKETGYDEKILNEAKVRYAQGKMWIRRKKAEYKLRKSNLHRVDPQG